MTEDEERIRQLETELGAVRARFKIEQAERLALWPKAELADTFLALCKRARGTIQRYRKNLVGVELRQGDLLLTDIARVMLVVEEVDDQEAHQNQPCFACGAMAGTMETPGGRFSRCNSCGYAG